MAQEKNDPIEDILWCAEEFAFFNRLVKVNYVDVLKKDVDDDDEIHFMGKRFLEDRGVWFKPLKVFCTKDTDLNTAVIFGIQGWIKKKDLDTFIEMVEDVNRKAIIINHEWEKTRKQIFKERFKSFSSVDVEI